MNSFTHACSFSLSFSLFSFSLTLTLRDWGFPVTWALSSPLLNLSLVLHHFCFSLSLTSFSVSLEPWLSILHALSLSLTSFLCTPLSAGFLSLLYQCVCSVFVTGQLDRKEDRLMATEILNDSGPVRCKRCPWGACVSYSSGMPQNTHPLPYLSAALFWIS